ncbi:hypothetical protein ADUPG1_011969 [Aduncisulcus paluster]|uniref:Protein kinase domain-containing protein n=1 Tax=Aduncisulcus paluster TaxID=2918883 RepID=A0ABQ5JZN7_9EUKA|nr:hypothetical protein ADUPG1_011969 [Aduncisulcus paluster]
MGSTESVIHRGNNYSIAIQMSSFADPVIQTVEPMFIHEGSEGCCPIPGDSLNIKSAEFPTIKAINGTKEEGKYGYDQSSNAQKMMRGEGNDGHFTHISIPFSSSSSMKGAYICLWDYRAPPSHLIFTLTSSKGDKTSKKFEFPGFKGYHWYFLPVDLPDVVLCEITGKGRYGECFNIRSLVFISREETPEEITSREAREKLWSEAPIVRPEFVKEGGRYSIPIPRDDPKLVAPSFSMVKCKNDSRSKESKGYDKSSGAQRMLKGEDDVYLSHLSIPFPSLSTMKAAYICVNMLHSSPSLLFTFTDCDGKKTSKKYEFTEPKHGFEWHFLPIDLDNVVLCEIEGKGRWCDKNSRDFIIPSLVFLRGDDIPTSPPLLTPVPVPSSFSQTPTSTLSLPSKPVKEIVIKGNDKNPTPKDTKQKKPKDKKKPNPKDGKPKYNPKHDSLTLTSASTLTSQCIIGSGGFGEVLLVLIDGIPFPCVLKKMLRVADKTVVQGCRKEFKVQLKLFNNPKCFNRIPRPLYILDLLDDDMKGVYGFLMEFCVGGSVSAFAKRWCADGKYVSTEDSEYSDDSEETDDTSSPFDPMTLNPVKVAALCVGMIECLDDVFKAKKQLLHRDIKPDNFLVRIDPKDGECVVVLADLGLVQIKDSISHSASSKNFIDVSSSYHSTKSDKKESTPKPKRSICGTLVYNSYEALRGLHSQKSDAYSLGISMFALFLCCDPFDQIPSLQWAGSPSEFVKELSYLLKNSLCPTIIESPLFKTLLTIDDGKYKSVHTVLNEVFMGLTILDVDKRMSVHQARERVQSIKTDLLPKLGDDFDCPSIEDIIHEQRMKNGGSVGVLDGGHGLDGVHHEEGWDQSR